MGFKKGNVSFSRFSVMQENPESNFIEEKLNSRAFNDFFPAEAREKWGWTLIDDPLDTTFSPHRLRFGPYILFSLRVDERRIPSSVLKLRCLERERELLAEEGLKKLSRHQRITIREMATKELAARIPPVPSFYEVCWSWKKACIYFSGTGQKTREDFVSYFEDTFDLPLTPHPELREPRITREFLTWLWGKAGEREGTIAISRQREIHLEFLKRVVLEAGEGEYAESILCQGIHTDFSEAKEALRQGKKIKEARLRLQEDREEWEFTFKADDFIIQGLRLPVATLNEEENVSEKEPASILERVSLMERLVEILDDLFNLFQKEAKI